jgi:hypothetical protein
MSIKVGSKSFSVVNRSFVPDNGQGVENQSYIPV